MKNSKFIIVAVLVAISMFILPGCEQQSVEENSQISETSLENVKSISKISDPMIIRELDFLYSKQAITKEQFCSYHKTGKLFSFNNEILYGVYGDGLLNREQVQDRMLGDETSKNSRYRVYTKMYTGGSISVRIHSGVPSEWVTAIASACSLWNSLGYNVKFYPMNTANTSDTQGAIDIYYGPLDPEFYAQTQYPTSNGGPGEYMIINYNFGLGNASAKQPLLSAKKQIILHELGHAVGFAHTNTSQYNGIGTSVSCNDIYNSSFMESGTPYNSAFSGFTSCDISVIDYFWG